MPADTHRIAHTYPKCTTCIMLCTTRCVTCMKNEYCSHKNYDQMKNKACTKVAIGIHLELYGPCSAKYYINSNLLERNIKLISHEKAHNQFTRQIWDQSDHFFSQNTRNYSNKWEESKRGIQRRVTKSISGIVNNAINTFTNFEINHLSALSGNVQNLWTYGRTSWATVMMYEITPQRFCTNALIHSFHK